MWGIYALLYVLGTYDHCMNAIRTACRTADRWYVQRFEATYQQRVARVILAYYHGHPAAPVYRQLISAMITALLVVALVWTAWWLVTHFLWHPVVATPVDEFSPYGSIWQPAS